MKIAIVINDLLVRGGTHKQVLRLCQYLVKNNVELILITKDYDSQKTYPEFSDFQIEVLDRKKNGLESNIKNGKIQNLMKKYKEDKALLKMIPDDVDLVNVHDNGTVWLMLWCKTKKHKKVVWQSNDLPVCFRVWDSKKIYKSPYYRVLRVLYRRIAKRIDQITVNVTKNKERIKCYMRSDAKVFYCGVDFNSRLKIHHFSNKTDMYRILSTGVFFERRNYTTLIEVIAYIKKKNIPIHLDIIGSTELDINYVKKVKECIRENQIEDDVTIWGQVDEEKYNELYNKANIFAFININQSWGLAVFEAMSCRLPVIVSNSVGAIELLTHNKNAIIVDPLNIQEISSEIIKLICDKNHYERIAENGYKSVQDYTWDKLYSSKMLCLFKELVGENK